MTYNNSYVSSSSALKSFASISDDTNDTLKDAKFFEVFSLTYMKDLPDNTAKADCNGNNCIVGCSCNTANGWEPIPASYSTRTSVGIIPPTSAQAKLYVTATTNFKTAYANGKLNSSPAQTSCRKQALPPYFIKISYSTSDKGNNVGFYQPATITTDDKTLTSVQIKYTGQIGKVMPSGWQYSATSYTYRLGNNTGEQNYTIPYSPKDVGLEGLGSYLSKPEVSLSLNGTTVIANTRLEEDNSFSILKNEWPTSISFNGKSYDLVFEQNASCPDGYFEHLEPEFTSDYLNVNGIDCFKPTGCDSNLGNSEPDSTVYDYTKVTSPDGKYTCYEGDCRAPYTSDNYFAEDVLVGTHNGFNCYSQESACPDGYFSTFGGDKITDIYIDSNGGKDASHVFFNTTCAVLVDYYAKGYVITSCGKHSMESYFSYPECTSKPEYLGTDANGNRCILQSTKVLKSCRKLRSAPTPTCPNGYFEECTR